MSFLTMARRTKGFDEIACRRAAFAALFFLKKFQLAGRRPQPQVPGARCRLLAAGGCRYG
ncbi:MAG: hypothetical protein QME73_13100 [Bacillota bacterium]|nr:hypothetical protein [Bacillota bacterium]